MPIIQCNGTHIAFKERGTGEPLILIMGLGAPGSFWDDHVKEYEKHFRCIVIDNRGTGESLAPAGPYTTRMMADDVAGVMDALKIPIAHVAGISMGSAIAQELALAHPSRVRSMALISSWARCDNYLKTIFENFCKARNKLSKENFAEMLQLWLFAAPYFETNMINLMDAQAAAAKDPGMPQFAYEAQCTACILHDTLDHISTIKSPTLLTVGDSDILTPLRLSKEMLLRLPKARMEVFQGCGHAHHWESLARFNRVTTEFFLHH